MGTSVVGHNGNTPLFVLSLLLVSTSTISLSDSVRPAAWTDGTLPHTTNRGRVSDELRKPTILWNRLKLVDDRALYSVVWTVILELSQHYCKENLPRQLCPFSYSLSPYQSLASTVHSTSNRHHIMASTSLAPQIVEDIPVQDKPSPRPEKPVLRHVEDIRQLGFTALFFAVFLFTWFSFSSPLSNGLLSLASWLALFQLAFMGAVSTHNAIHTPVFWDTRLNSFYHVCLSLQYGFSVSVFIPGHNLSHHKYPQQARDFSEFESLSSPSR